MDDTRFQELLDETTEAHKKYLKLLKKAEKEYLKRFGNLPSDVDDDFWIDSFHNSPLGATVSSVKHSAELRKSKY